MKSAIVTMAVGLVFLALIGFSEKADAQWVPYGWGYPPIYHPFYYPPPLPGYYGFPGYYGLPYGFWDYGAPIVERMPLRPGLGVGYPHLFLYEREGPDEKEGEEKIRNHLLSKKIPFRMRRSLSFATEMGMFSFEPDVQLPGKVALEYWSQSILRHFRFSVPFSASPLRGSALSGGKFPRYFFASRAKKFVCFFF